MTRSLFRKPSWAQVACRQNVAHAGAKACPGHVHASRVGVVTNPKRAAYNRVYDRTSISVWHYSGDFFEALAASSRAVRCIPIAACSKVKRIAESMASIAG